MLLRIEAVPWPIFAVERALSVYYQIANSDWSLAVIAVNDKFETQYATRVEYKVSINST